MINTIGENLKNYEIDEFGVLQTSSPKAGLENYIDFAIDIANQEGSQIIGKFNGIDIILYPNASRDDILKQRNNTLKRQKMVDKNSAKYKEAQMKKEESMKNYKEKVNLEILKLDNLNYNSLEEIMKWIKDFQNATGGVYEITDSERDTIINKFGENGFLDIVEPIDENYFNKLNKKQQKVRKARSIIENALDMISKVGDLHDAVYPYVIEKWEMDYSKEEINKEDQITNLEGKLKEE